MDSEYSLTFPIPEDAEKLLGLIDTYLDSYTLTENEMVRDSKVKQSITISTIRPDNDPVILKRYKIITQFIAITYKENSIFKVAPLYYSATLDI